MSKKGFKKLMQLRRTVITGVKTVKDKNGEPHKIYSLESQPYIVPGCMK